MVLNYFQDVTSKYVYIYRKSVYNIYYICAMYIAVYIKLTVYIHIRPFLTGNIYIYIYIYIYICYTFTVYIYIYIIHLLYIYIYIYIYI